jgi:Sec-independent protein translocase protein TatA
MAVGGVEWVVVGAIAIMILVWGPNNIPKFARVLAQARREFDLAQKMVLNPEPMGAAGLSDDDLIAKARGHGIVTMGKTRDELSAEIARVTSQRAGQPNASSPVQGTAVQAAPVRSPAPATYTPTPAPAQDQQDRMKLVLVAHGLGLNDEGKSDEQLKEEIKRALG